VIQDNFLREVILIRGLMSNEEWECFAPFVIEGGQHSGRRPRDHRLVLDGVFWIARTGVQWRDLPEYFGKWSSVYRQFRRWTLAGLWETLLESLNDSGEGNSSLQMIDSTIVRAHHCAAGAKGGLKDRVLGAQKVALRRKYTSGPMARDCR
jgi:transposase